MGYDYPNPKPSGTGMLDVHPPHSPTHTWKDFFIHIATITVGLLIAVSLEQTVEYFHHVHQRHQLEEDLRSEAEINLSDIDNYYRQVDLTMANIVANRDRVDAMRASGAKIKVAYLPFVITGNRGAAARRPSSSAWTIAKEQATAALLPGEEGKFYSRVYLQFDLLTEAIAREQDAVRERANFEDQFSVLPKEPSATLVPDISRMTVEQLDQEKALLTKQWLAKKEVRNRLDFLYSAETAVVQGRKYEHSVLELYQPHPLKEDPPQQ